MQNEETSNRFLLSYIKNEEGPALEFQFTIQFSFEAVKKFPVWTLDRAGNQSTRRRK